MKTAVRIQEREDSQRGFGFMSIQILVPTSPRSETMTPIGHISFQRTLDDELGRTWYAMRFNVETDNIEYLEKMTKIARVIKKNSNWDSQPKEILKIIGAVEYKIFNQEFTPVSKEGENLYDVFFLASLYKRIIAPSEKAARKKMEKQGLNKHELKFNSKIEFNKL